MKNLIHKKWKTLKNWQKTFCQKEKLFLKKKLKTFKNLYLKTKNYQKNWLFILKNKINLSLMQLLKIKKDFVLLLKKHCHHFHQQNQIKGSKKEKNLFILMLGTVLYLVSVLMYFTQGNERDFFWIYFFHLNEKISAIIISLYIIRNVNLSLVCKRVFSLFIFVQFSLILSYSLDYFFEITIRPALYLYPTLLIAVSLLFFLFIQDR